MAPKDGGAATPARLRSFIDHRLERDKVRFVCLAILAMNLVLAAVSFLTFDGTATLLGPAPGIDFAGFYTAGKILNGYPPQRLYDLQLQDDLFHQLLPGLPAAEKLPYVYPPFFSLLFRPLALMPYTWACLTWMLISVALYLAGLALIWPSLRAIPTGERSTALLLALSFQPFMECWLSGQTSAFGFAAMALALRCEVSGRPLGLGLALSLCLYKPPLLLLILPMLVIARRWRALGGFAAGGSVLAGVSALAIGWRGCLAYFGYLATFSRAMHSGAVAFPSWKFVDLDHFLGQLAGVPAPYRVFVWVVVALAALPPLVRAWWVFDSAGPDRGMLTWSATLTWTLVLNAYIGVYDAILAVPGLLFVADALYRRAGASAKALTPGFQSLLILLYLIPWVSQHLARSTGFQPLTIVLVALGAYQLMLAGRERCGDRWAGWGRGTEPPPTGDSCRSRLRPAISMLSGSTPNEGGERR
jgi:hypothetical protein